MRLTIFLAVFTAAAFGFTTPDHAPGAADFQRWRMLGGKKVNFVVERDVIEFGNVKDDYRKLMIKVSDGPVKIKDVKIYFDNGGVQDVQIRKLIPQGGSSRVIDLTGGARSLRKIEFWYETAGFANGKGTVSVWGR